jgi:hypothetical protein
MMFLTFDLKSKNEAIGLNPADKCRMLYIISLHLAAKK